MNIASVSGSSTLLQFVTAILALRLIAITGERKAWTLISIALSLMAIRRSITLFHMISGDIPYTPDVAAEWVSLATSVLMLAGIAWIVPLFRSIKSTSDALRQSEEKYRSIFENAVEGIFQSTPEGRYIDINPAMAQMFGYGSAAEMMESITNISQQHYADPAKRAEFKRLFEEVGIVQGFETKLFRKDGSAVWVSINARAVRDPKGEILYYEGTLENITKRKHGEEKLRQSEERYRSLFETSPNIVFSVAAEGITSLNPAFEKITGWKCDEWLGKSFMGIVHPEDLPIAMAALEKILNGETPPPFELRILMKSGEYHIEEITSAPQIQGGKVAEVFGIARDITERKREAEAQKRLESQLLQVQKMEALGTLAGGIAHDFNNIIGIIQGFTQLAVLKIPEETPGRSHLEDVLEASERAGDLVRQILAFSRRSEPSCRPTQFCLIAKEALKLLRASIPSTIEIRQNIASTGMVLADPTHIHQVLMNLCTNSAHAMQEQGGVMDVGLVDFEVSVEFASRYPDLIPGPYLKLTVSDTGTGIDAKLVGRIFEPYFTTKASGKGTGLGLSVVHGIVKSYGGTITVYSEPGKGSTFHLFFPQFDNEAGGVKRAETGYSMPTPTGTEHILFLDDEEQLCKFGRVALEHLGYKVTIRTCSVEALELLRAQPEKFDLLITDQTMPQMTGIDLARKVLGFRADLPIILCTGFSGLLTREKIRAIGIRELIMKPFVVRELAGAIRRALDAESSQP